MSGGLARATALLLQGQRFLVTCHVAPDADAVGSMLGVAEVLRAAGKDVVLYNRDPIPEALCFLAGTGDVLRTIPNGVRFDATVIVDTAARVLLPRAFPAADVTGPVIILDHHLRHDEFGDVIVRDVQACATAVVVVELARALGVDPVPAKAAEPLYTALVADTGNFRYPGTNAATLRLAATLLETGIDPWRVASQVFENWPKPRLALLGRMIERIEFLAEDQVAILLASHALIDEVGASDRMVDGLVDYARVVRGVEVAVLISEQANAEDDDAAETVCRVSLRGTGRVDVSQIALALGGGGHRSAAGVTLRCDLSAARARVVAETLRVLATGSEPS